MHQMPHRASTPSSHLTLKPTAARNGVLENQFIGNYLSSYNSPYTAFSLDIV